MGGRVASLVADALLHADGQIAGLLCIGYPFHAPGQPERLRTAHLAALGTPALICQGSPRRFRQAAPRLPTTRSPTTIEIVWLEDGDHDLKPRKRPDEPLEPGQPIRNR